MVDAPNAAAPWEQDEIVSPAPTSAPADQPWLNDPIEAAPADQPWLNDPVVQPQERPKLTYQNMYDDPEFGEVAQRYYARRLGRPVERREAIDRVISTGRWADANTGQNAIEFARTRGMSDEDKRDFAYLRQRYNELPYFWQEGGAGWTEGLTANLWRGALDPINFAGPALRVAGAAAKGIPLAGRGLTRAGEALSTMRGTVAADAVGSAAGNVANQAVENEVGLRDGYSAGEAALAGVVGGAVSLGGNYAANRLFRSNTAPGPASISREVDAQLTEKTGPDVDTPDPEGVLSRERRIYQGIADMTEAAADMQRRRRKLGDATGSNVRDLSQASRVAGGEVNDDNSFTRFRGLAGTVARVKQFMDDFTFLPQERGAQRGTAEASYGRQTGEGFNRIVAPFRQDGRFDFLMEYENALRARDLRDHRNPFEYARAFEATLRDTDEYRNALQTLKAQKVPDPEAAALNVVQRMAQPGSALWKAADDAGRAKMIPLGKYGDDSAFLGDGRNATQARQLAGNQIDEIIRRAEAEPGFKEAHERLQKFWANVLDYGVSAQVISRAAADAMQGKAIPSLEGRNINYTPWLPATRAKGSGKSTGDVGGVGNSPFKKRLTGNMGNRADPEEMVEGYLSRAIASGDRNLANLAYVDEVLDLQQRGGFGGKPVLRAVHDHAAAKAIARQDAEKALKRLGFTPQDLSELDLVQASILAERRGKATSGESRLLTVFRNGKREVYEVLDPDHIRMFEALAPEDLGAFRRFTRGFARFRADLITNSPPFIAWNMFKDTVQAAVHSPHGFKAFWDTGKGIGMVLGQKLHPTAAGRQKNRDLVKLAQRSGVGFSGRNSAAQVASQGGYVAPLGRDHGVWGSIKDFLEHNPVARGWQAWVEFNNQLEMAPRLVEFKLAKMAGMSDLGAGFAGREVAVDYSRRGAYQWVRDVGGMTSFLNASTQGMDRTWRALAKEKTPAKLAVIAFATVTPPLLLHMINSDHETYEKMPWQQRLSAAWFPAFRNWEEGMAWVSGQQTQFLWDDGRMHRSPQADFVAMPLPEAVGSVVSAVTGVLDAIRTGNGEKALAGFWQGALVNMPGVHLPDFIEPAAQLATTGEDGMGRPITPQHLQGVDAIHQVSPNTSGLAVLLAEIGKKITGNLRGDGREGVVPFTPVELDFLGRSYLPGVVSLLVQGVSQVARDTGRYGEKPAARMDEYDVRGAGALYSHTTRRFLREGNHQTNAQLNEFYELAGRAEKAARGEATERNSLRGLQSGRQPVASETEMLRRLAPSLKSVRDSLSNIGKRIDDISVHPQMSAADKRKQIDALIAQRDEIVDSQMTMLRKSVPVLSRSWLNPHPEKQR